MDTRTTKRKEIIVIDDTPTPTTSSTPKRKLFSSTQTTPSTPKRKLFSSPDDWSKSPIQWESEIKLMEAREKYKELKQKMEDLENFLFYVPSMSKLEVAKDGLKFATFLGLYPSLYDLVVELLQLKRGEKDDWNSAMAGGVAGLAICVEDRTRRHIYCVFAIARAIGAIVSTMVKRDVVPFIPYSETALFSLCTGFLVYCTALKPQYLLPGYYRSVLKWSRDYTDTKLTKLFREPGKSFLSCADVELHDHSCLYHAVMDFIQSFPPFAKLYLPIHTAPIVLSRYKLLLRRPWKVIKSLIRNVFWSTCFLCTMVMLAKYVICLLRNLQGRPPPLSSWIPAVAGLVAGLGVLFERMNRRKELSLFLIPHTLYAVYLWGRESRVISHIRNSSVFLFALSMVPIMHAYEREPESLSLLIHSVLKYFVGQRMSTKERERRRLDSEMLN